MSPPRVGGGIAGLVAADALACGGRPVRLLLPERGVGGGFLPMRRDGLRLELGVRLLELGYEDDVRTTGTGRVRPRLRRPPAVRAADRGLGRPSRRRPRRRRARPEVVVDRSAHDDVFFSVDLTGLPALLGPARRAPSQRGRVRPRHATEGPDCSAPRRGTSRSSRRLAAQPRAHPPRGPSSPRHAEKFLAGGAGARWRAGGARSGCRCSGRAPSRGLQRRAVLRSAAAGDRRRRGPGAVVDALLDRLRATPA